MIPSATARLQFREMTVTDLDSMAALLGDADVMRFYPAPKTRDEALDWIKWTLNNYATHGYGLWVVETFDGEFVGDCGLTWQKVNDVSALEVGYHVRPELQGRGYATEAASACRDFAREHTREIELVAVVHPDNQASQGDVDPHRQHHRPARTWTAPSPTAKPGPAVQHHSTRTASTRKAAWKWASAS